MDAATPLHPDDALSVNLSVRECAEALSRRIEANPAVAASRVVGSMHGGEEMDWWRAKRLLIKNGYVSTNTCDECPSLHHYSVRPYRVATDPDAEARPDLMARLEAMVPDMIEALVAAGEVRLIYDNGSLRVVDPALRF